MRAVADASVVSMMWPLAIGPLSPVWAPGRMAATASIMSLTLWPNTEMPTAAIKVTPAIIRAYSTSPWPFRLRINSSTSQFSL